MEITTKFNIGDKVWVMGNACMAWQGKIIKINTKDLYPKYTLVFTERPCNKHRDYMKDVEEILCYASIQDLDIDYRIRTGARIYTSQEVIDYYDGKLSEMEFTKYIRNLDC